MPRSRITALNVYPVKSCAGLSQDRVRVAARGLVATTPSGSAGDREWMIVDRDAHFVSQREHPQLALIHTSLHGGMLVLAAQGRAELAVPVAPQAGTTREVVVWNSHVPAHDAGDAAAAWFSALLGADVRLVRFDPAHQRLSNPVYAGNSGAHTAFADGYPLLVIAESSLTELNGRLAVAGSPALPMNRFRPNIVLSGLDPFDEDHIDTLSLEGIAMKLVKPCTRCQITTTDQATAQVGMEPLATLRGFRMDDRLGGVTFGMNAIVVAGEGRELSVGTDLEVSFAF